MFMTILTITIIVCGILCHFIAQSRGLKPVFWGVMGVVFGPFAVLYLLLFKRKENSSDAQ